MSNRTNRTLSANPNRLNLGTRSLARTLGGNMGYQQALRIRHDHPRASILFDAVRAGFPVVSMRPECSGPVGPSDPGSPSRPSRLHPSRPAGTPVVVVEAPPVFVPVVPDGTWTGRGVPATPRPDTATPSAKRSKERADRWSERTGDRWAAEARTTRTARATVTCPRIGAATVG